MPRIKSNVNPNTMGSFKSKRKSAIEVHWGKSSRDKPPTSFSDLPDDVMIMIQRIQGLWQVILTCQVLRVVVGYSDYEHTLEKASEEALTKYAKTKGLS